jgi:hypothetical protein
VETQQKHTPSGKDALFTKISLRSPLPRGFSGDCTLFGRALEIDSAGDGNRYLADACGENVELRAEVEQLLAAMEKAGDLLAGRAHDTAPTQAFPAQESVGSQIGPYRLLQVLGEGGMGTVMMAEQKEPVKRRVALKIIKPGMDSQQVIARFEAERQALAMMDHPNIARVLDAGSTASGRPFFVMELVKGVPLNQYCDEHHLTPRERLELFVPICQAIQHAHQKGVIHRDLKPSKEQVDLPLELVAGGQRLEELSAPFGIGDVERLMVRPEKARASGVAGSPSDAHVIRQREILPAQLARHDRSQTGKVHTASPFVIARVHVVGGQLMVRFHGAHAAEQGGGLDQPGKPGKVLADLDAGNRSADGSEFAANAIGGLRLEIKRVDVARGLPTSKGECTIDSRLPRRPAPPAAGAIRTTSNRPAFRPGRVRKNRAARGEHASDRPGGLKSQTQF